MIVNTLTGITDVGTIAADSRVVARSANTGPVKLPSNLPLSETGEVISQWLGSAEGVPIAGQPTYSIWHAVTNFPQLIQGTFVVTATGQRFTLWNGDVITVTDSNGWTAQFQWTPLSSIQWTLVPGSIRDQNGNPVGASKVPTVPPSAALNSAAFNLSYPSGPTVTVIPYNFDNGSLPRGVITVDPYPYGGGGSHKELPSDQP